ncbi:MAG TPA: Do family serine endopeptidase [Verrucomicrobiae bacterium]|nr:Do family serine endopeptidase [Verrucomicrobiae bacterium]
MERHFSKPFFNLFSVALGGAAVILALSRVPDERSIPNPSPESHPVAINVQGTPASRGATAVSSYAEAVKRAAPSVVNIYSSKTVTDSDNALLNDPLLRHFFGDHLLGSPDTSSKPHKSQSLGSGVICSSDGYILTDFHVVDNADEIKVNLADGRTEYSAKVIGGDPQTDVAIVKINATNLPTITMGNSDNLQVGDVVLALGNPFGVGQTVTMGIASAVGRGGFGVEDIEDFIQTDASINPGNSGGALVDSQGRLIGINAAILSRSGGNQGIGFAVPVNLAREVMEQILQFGRVMRGYLGVTTQALTPDLAKAFNMPQKQTGALIGEVSPNSPASAAGLHEGDVITGYNGKAVNDSRELRLLIAQSSPHTNANLQILRHGKIQGCTATLSETPHAKTPLPFLTAKASATGKVANSDESSLDAVEVSDLSGDVRQMLEIPSSINGAVVAKVEPGSDSYEAGLRVGDVITDVNGQTVKNADSAIGLCHRTRGGMALLRVWSKDGKHYIAVNNQVATK